MASLSMQQSPCCVFPLLFVLYSFCSMFPCSILLFASPLSFLCVPPFLFFRSVVAVYAGSPALMSLSYLRPSQALFEPSPCSLVCLRRRHTRQIRFRSGGRTHT